MDDIRKINIWKNDPGSAVPDDFLDMDISELNLSVRSFNCLKRAGCATIGDVKARINSDGGLKSIRNLGSRSEAEIVARIDELEQKYASAPHTSSRRPKNTTVIRPAKKIWDMDVEDFHLSEKSLYNLRSCGIKKVKDLYIHDTGNEPGWYAVRELFRKIPG